MAQCVQHCGSVVGLYGMDVGNIQCSHDTLVSEGSIYKHLLLHCWNKKCYMLTTQIRKMLRNSPIKNVELQCVPPSLLYTFHCHIAQREFDSDTNNFSLHIFYTNIEHLHTGYWPSENQQDLCKLQTSNNTTSTRRQHDTVPKCSLHPHARLEEEKKNI